MAGGMNSFDLEKSMARKGMSPQVRARVRRLNPNPQLGELLRGWHPTRTLNRIRWLEDCIGKREFITKFGRNAWDKLPGYAIRKEGRRAYVSRYTVEDNVWLTPEGRR